MGRRGAIAGYAGALRFLPGTRPRRGAILPAPDGGGRFDGAIAPEASPALHPERLAAVEPRNLRGTTMMKLKKDAAVLVGRILLALMFVISGFGKIGAFADTTVYMAGAGIPAIDAVLEALLILTILVELGGGTALILGWKTRPAALSIFLFTGLVTLVFHRFWAVPPDEAMGQQLMFMKNLSVMGGLLLLFAHGPGDYALDDAD